ncbi:hypothetical protein HanRHA438_Chr14g0677511 [Helianthus annuus]|nr:hypothetical protein HanRHA438_Chr14g0677511 [Helianthus annuus]
MSFSFCNKLASKGVFVFLQKLFIASFVCVTQITRRHLGLQSVCFSGEISLKKVYTTSFWCRCGIPSSNLFFASSPPKHIIQNFFLSKP